MSEMLAESTDAVDATDAADVSDVSDATATDATDVADAADATDAAPAVDWNSPEAQAVIAEQTQAQFADFLQQISAQQESYAEPIPAPDPFADNYQEQLEAWQEDREQRFLAQIDQRLAPVQEFQNERVNSQVNTILDETATANNIDPGHREVLEVLANGFASRVQGDGEPAVRQATALAAQQLQSLIKSSEEAAVKRYQDSVRGVGTGDREPGVAGGALGIEQPGQGYGDRFSKVMERHGLSGY